MANQLKRSSSSNVSEQREILDAAEDDENRLRRSRKRVSIKLPPRVPTEDDERENETGIRRTQTLPSPVSGDLSERRSRRTLSRVFSDEAGAEDLLVDSQKRHNTSRRALNAGPSDKGLRPGVSKKVGRAATPLDIPFAPNPAISRSMSAETGFQDMVDMELDASLPPLRRTRTQAPTTFLDDDEEVEEEEELNDDMKIDPIRQEPARSSKNLGSVRQSSERRITLGGSSRPQTSGDPLTRDSAKELERHYVSAMGEKLKARDMAGEEFKNKEHVVAIDPPSKKNISSAASSSKKISEKSSSRKLKPTQDRNYGKPISLLRWILHFIGLIFVQYPFRYHRQWLEKMYRADRLQRPKNYKPMPEWDFTALGMKGGGRSSELPSLPENASGFTSRPLRVRRRTQLGEDDDDEFDDAVLKHHGKRPSSFSGQCTMNQNRPPPGHLPRSRNIDMDRSRRKKNRKSVEIFGDIMQALGIHTKGGRLKLPFGISDMDESELSGFHARFYKFIKRQHKGRLARAWDHLVHPLSSMQKKHRRSTNKVRLLNAIDKQRDQRYENGVDMVKTHLFLIGQWVFEALSPPKFTKKPMLFTVLFPLVLILFFGFMAGEYALWKESNGENIAYEFGPQELLTWVFKSEKWRTFDGGFLIVWGARYLPLVTTESWRWLSSMLVHENFAHLGGNLMLFLVLSWPLESKYGFIRTGTICWLSGIAGNFMSAALEDECGIVLGASGCVFGLAAFYVVDVVGDFKYVSFPCLRLMGICAFLSAFIIALTSHQEASHFSHIGGFLCGMGLSLVLVPRFIDERIEAFLPWVALFSGILLLCIFPLIVLLTVIPDLSCTS